MTEELEREATRNKARTIAGRLNRVPGWLELSDVASGNTWRWTNALVYSIGSAPLLLLDGRIADPETNTAEVVAITEERVVYASGRVDGSYPVVAVFPRASLKTLEVLEPALAIENDNYLITEPQARVRLSYGNAAFNLPFSAENRMLSREVDRLLPSLFEDLSALASARV